MVVFQHARALLHLERCAGAKFRRLALKWVEGNDGGYPALGSGRESGVCLATAEVGMLRASWFLCQAFKIARRRPGRRVCPLCRRLERDIDGKRWSGERNDEFQRQWDRGDRPLTKNDLR
jgi:hypothetical protein